MSGNLSSHFFCSVLCFLCTVPPIFAKQSHSAPPFTKVFCGRRGEIRPNCIRTWKVQCLPRNQRRNRSRLPIVSIN